MNSKIHNLFSDAQPPSTYQCRLQLSILLKFFLIYISIVPVVSRYFFVIQVLVVDSANDTDTENYLITQICLPYMD